MDLKKFIENGCDTIEVDDRNLYTLKQQLLSVNLLDDFNSCWRRFYIWCKCVDKDRWREAVRKSSIKIKYISKGRKTVLVVIP